LSIQSAAFRAQARHVRFQNGAGSAAAASLIGAANHESGKAAHSVVTRDNETGSPFFSRVLQWQRRLLNAMML